MRRLHLVLLVGAAAVLASALPGLASVIPPDPGVPVPEPSTFHLLGTGVAVLLGSAGFYNMFKK
jgi:hypothetical protein